MGLLGRLRNIFRAEEDNYIDDLPEREGYDNQAEPDDIVKDTELEEPSLGKKPSPEDISRYLDAVGARIALMEKQNNALKGEYESVTGYLQDIQLIEAIEGSDKEKLLRIASDIVGIEEDNRKRMGHDREISDSHYNVMKQYEEEMNHELIFMKKKELYQADIKSDMKHLEEEKKRLLKEKKDYSGKHVRIRQVSVGAGVLIVSFMILLGVLWAVSKTDYTIPFIILIFISGLLVLYIFTGMRDLRYQLLLVDKKINRCINLLNSVKIKYVNNTALLDYMCSKYRVSNSLELEKVWMMYIKVKEDEQMLAANKEELVMLKTSLETLLGEYGVNDVNIWTCQTKALLDKREMVEVRHGLNTRRQKLRNQISYNDDKIRHDAYIMQAFLKKKPKLRNIVGGILKKYEIDQTIISALRQ